MEVRIQSRFAGGSFATGLSRSHVMSQVLGGSATTLRGGGRGVTNHKKVDGLKNGNGSWYSLVLPRLAYTSWLMWVSSGQHFFDEARPLASSSMMVFLLLSGRNLDASVWGRAH